MRLSLGEIFDSFATCRQSRQVDTRDMEFICLKPKWIKFAASVASGAVISSCCGANCKLLRTTFSVFSVPLTVCRCAALSFSVFHFPCTIFCFQFKVFSNSFCAPLAVCGHLFGPVIVIYMYCASCRHVSPHCGRVRALFQPV